MAAKPRKKTTRRRRLKKRSIGQRLRRFIWRWSVRLISSSVILLFVIIMSGRFVNPITTLYIMQERARLGQVDRDWVGRDAIAPVMMRAAVAAEDANFCLHWGIDIEAIRVALSDGTRRGASTISQQMVKNLYLWPERSWTRKAAEAFLTPFVEALWPKTRILEVYLNIAEFDEGVFGIGAASQHYFDKAPADLTAREASLLAAVLPSPKSRSAARPSAFVNRRAAAIRDGAALIRADGRSSCFES